MCVFFLILQFNLCVPWGIRESQSSGPANKIELTVAAGRLP